MKAAFAQWLVERGAAKVLVSLDGMEQGAKDFPQYLARTGFTFERNLKSKAAWVGSYRNGASVVVECCSRPGLDIEAAFTSDAIWVAECKGEPTASGIKAGSDLTSLYCCLGQLISSAGKMLPLPQRRFLVVPNSDRLQSTMAVLAANPLLQGAGIEIAVVDRMGQVTIL